MHAYEFLVDQLGPQMLADVDRTEARRDMSCIVCDRPASSWAMGGTTAFPVFCVYRREETHQCPTCRVLSARPPEALGIERTMGGTPVYFSLTSLKGGYLIVEEGHKPELWLGGKYPDKMSNAVFNVRNVSGHAALLALLERPFTRRALVIEVSLRRERIARNLVLSLPGLIALCDEQGVVWLPQHGWSAFADALRAMLKKNRNDSLTLLKGLVSGRYQPNDPLLQDLWAAEPVLAEACRALPIDPHARAKWLDAGTVL